MWPGVRLLEGDCVGVTDGSYVLEPELRDVLGKIRAENERVSDEPHVTVALMGAFTTTGGGLVPIKRIREQLEGAYVAQHLRNEGGTNPKIRLVIASKGSREQAWREVSEQLIGMTGEPDNLVAVIGPGLSTASTASSLSVLTGAGIPVVGNQITADRLDTRGTGVGGPFPGLVRVNVTVHDELTTLATYLRDRRPDVQTAMLVGDSNPADLYTQAMQRNFTEGPLSTYWAAAGGGIQPYDGRPESPGAEAQFRAIVANLCGENSPDVVFYAGRALLLPEFVQGLRRRGCARTRTITVVTGSDATALSDTLPPAQETDAPVSVLYSPLAAPIALSDPKWNPELPLYQRFEAAFEDSGFDLVDLSDGWGIMTHDATLAAISAIERTAGQSRTIPTPQEVGSMLRLLNSETTAVPGAAGRFTFDPTTGNVRGRMMHVIEMSTDGTLEVLAMYPQPVN